MDPGGSAGVIFIETSIPDVWIVDPEARHDDRGFFARTFCREEFSARGLESEFVQCSISFNRAKGTLRGMHYQDDPAQETKLVRCTQGSIYDVALDLRPQCGTYRKWVAVELSASNRRMLYIPQGVAHGFQTLEPSAEVFYQISPAYHPGLARGVRWNDPAFAIDWPDDDLTIAPRDASFPDFVW